MTTMLFAEKVLSGRAQPLLKNPSTAAPGFVLEVKIRSLGNDASGFCHQCYLAQHAFP